MTMIGAAGYASNMITLGAGVAKSLIDMGFTEEQIAVADSVHISVYNQDVWFWYSGRTPAVGDGHKITANGERIVRSIRNIRNLKMIASANNALLAITLATFGRTPV